MFMLMCVAVLPLYLYMWWMHWFFCSESRARGVAAAIVTFCSLWPLPCVKYLTYLTCFHCVWICPSLTPPGVRKLSFTSNRFRFTGADGRGLAQRGRGHCSFCLAVDIVCRPPWCVAAVHPEKPPVEFRRLYFHMRLIRGVEGIAAFCVCVCVCWGKWVMSHRMFLSNALLPLRQVSFCRDTLSPPWGDSQRADSPRTCGDSGFISPGCLALSSYPLRVGGAVPWTQGAAGRETLGWTEGGWWRTGTER